ncbi:MAG: Rrf2 family transcriptional regulator [Pirellulaceae bacterium]|jgi:Rrf2 family protein|nr:Rrf2 family transcriptional regulator [Pirellulaceae bacterium]
MKLLSDASEYALRAVIWLAQHPEEPQKVRDIAENTRAAPGYLVKILQNLAKAGILSGQRGTRGGFTLIRDPDTLSVLEVINAVDPIERIRQCPLRLKTHSERLCPMHHRVDQAMAAVETAFRDSTIKELLDAPGHPRALCNELDEMADCLEGGVE